MNVGVNKTYRLMAWAGFLWILFFWILFDADHLIAQSNWQLPATVSATVDGDLVTLEVAAGVGKFEIPNLHAPIRSLTIPGNDSNSQPTIVPLTDTWSIKIPKQSAITKIELQLESLPLMTGEIPVAKPAADETITIPAHYAQTFGEKLRYEPQPWKSTVGYWTVVGDFAVFAIEIKKGGTYNVGVLQGCGKDNGGSTATFELFRDPAKGKDLANCPERMKVANRTDGIEFKTIETGHFQDFRWNHVGQVTVSESGYYLVKLGAKAIKKTAIMDTRTISLTIVPKQ